MLPLIEFTTSRHELCNQEARYDQEVVIRHELATNYKSNCVRDERVALRKRM